MQDEVQGGHGVVRSDIRHADALVVHATHTEEPATLPVDKGHVVHTVDDEKYENFPAGHAKHTAEPSAEAYVPGLHCTHDTPDALALPAVHDTQDDPDSC